ncbi:MAG: hypothetical protein HOO91_17170 [Bacteroidales bacterium]|nr:hypothetical protein [Bacteroidales bacterium]
MLEYKEIKDKFNLSFSELLNNNSSLKYLLYEIFVYGSAYIVGGYLRDLINDKSSRDIDIIIDLKHEKLLELLRDSNSIYAINRHNGIKIQYKNVEVDMWSIENNWAFKNNLVKLNDEKKLNSIAKGCFYNFDALVINLHTSNLDIKYYNDFIKNNCLEILQSSPLYKNLNPTTEANILRAFYLRKLYNIDYSSNTKQYLIKKIGNIRDRNKNSINKLLETKLKYPKYDNTLSNDDLYFYINELINSNEINNQFLLKL